MERAYIPHLDLPYAQQHAATHPVAWIADVSNPLRGPSMVANPRHQRRTAQRVTNVRNPSNRVSCSVLLRVWKIQVRYVRAFHFLRTRSRRASSRVSAPKAFTT